MQIDMEPKRPLATALGVTATIFNFVLVVSAATPAEPPPPKPRVTYLRLDQVRIHKPIEDRITPCAPPCYSLPISKALDAQDRLKFTAILFTTSPLTSGSRATLGRFSSVKAATLR
jgi:hypothetical protein